MSIKTKVNAETKTTVSPEEQYQQQLADWEKARFAPAPVPPPQPIEPSLTAMVPMRDGTRLYTEVFLPKANKADAESMTHARPIIFIRSPYPYSKPSLNGKLWVTPFLEKDYGVVYQLVRGQGESEGSYRMYFNDIDDGFDAIEWIDQQAWCDGNVGMTGASYLGSAQLYAARAHPPALKCIMPTAFVGTFTRCVPYHWGVPYKTSYMQWHQVLNATRWDDMDVPYGDLRALEHPKWGPALKTRPIIDAANTVLSGDKLAAFKETIAHPMDDEYWQTLHYSDEDLAALKLPIFMTDGWYDCTIGPIEFFSRMEQLGLPKDDRYLLVGPWNHYQTGKTSKPGEDDGDRILPDNGAIDLAALKLAFFDRYLRGDSSVTVQEDRVKVYISGANKWLGFDSFPAPETKQLALYLHSEGDARSFPGDGVLNLTKPDEEPTDRYAYDPEVTPNFPIEKFIDRRPVEVRSDVLTYTTAPLTKAMTILGEISLVLHAASDAPDTDWFAAVTEVTPDGQSRSFHYAPMGFRARYREGLDKEVFLQANKPEVFNIPLGPAGHQIAVGNCLRLSIFSASFPECEPNSNTGANPLTDTNNQIAQQTIYHDKARPSHLLLPIIECD